MFHRALQSLQLLKESDESIQFLARKLATTGRNLDTVLVFDEMQILDW